MTGAAATPVNGVRRAVRLCLAAQIVLAGFLAVETWQSRPGTAWQVPPAQPGDQRRPYRPRVAPGLLPGGGGEPFPDLPDFDSPQVVIVPNPLDGGGTRLQVSGRIAAGDAARLADALDAAAPPLLVTLHSPGGVMAEGLEMGRLLREAEAVTEVPEGGACLSACPLAFAGGAERRVSGDAWLGLHQSYFDQSSILPAFLAVEQIQYGEAQVLRHLDAMGIDPMTMVHALETPPKEIYVLNAEERQRYGWETGPEGGDEGLSRRTPG